MSPEDKEEFLRALYKAYGEPQSPTVVLPKSLVASGDERFSIGHVISVGTALGFRVQARDCTRSRRRTRFTFRASMGGPPFLKWLKEGSDDSA